MRFAVFVFSLVLVVMPAYVHAIVFVPAITGALVRTASGAVVKVANKKTLLASAVGLGVSTAVDYCKKNKQKCKDWVGDVAETFFDDGDNNKEDPVCPGKVVYTLANSVNGKRPSLSASSYKDYCQNFSHREVFGFAYSYFGSNHQINEVGEERQSNASAVKTCEWSYTDIDGKKRTKTESVYKSCIYNPNNTSQYQQEKETQKQAQAQKIIERIKDDDPDYIINNYGDTINIEQYCSAHACDELTAEFGDEVMKNKSKYDIDKINKANCEVENNKIKSCDKAKKQLELDFEAEAEQPKDDEDTDPTPKGDKTDDIDCDSSKFHKKICQFINWTQTDDDPPQDTKLDIDEPDAPKNKDTNINFVGTCPAPYVLEFVIDFGFIGRKDVSITLLDTPKLCNFLDTWVAPIMLFVGPLHAIYILGGGSREI